MSLLRVEGVNLSAVLEDTDQLSVIRGASLMLRQAILDLAGGKAGIDLETISRGASVGLFRVPDGQPSRIARDEVAGWLQETFPDLTFVVDVQQESGQFRRDLESLIARNRFRQLAEVSVAVPEKNDALQRGPCAWDDRRPADAGLPIRRDDDDLRVSGSARRRYEWGRTARQSFYSRETGRDCAIQFAEDLHQLSEDGGYPWLEDKIAVIYIDGNKFSDIQTKHCDSPDALGRFDTEVQKRRREYLGDLLERAAAVPDLLNEGALRLETLLWGGDEIEIVVPAWRGLWALSHFFECAKDWAFQGDRLTHSAGMVFCRSKTPIARVRGLARELCGQVKDWLNVKKQRDDRYLYVVLESIDFPTQPIAEFQESKYGAAAATLEPLKPPPSAVLQQWSRPHALEDLPRKQCYAVARAALGEAGENSIAERKKRLGQVWNADSLGVLEANLSDTFPDCSETWRWVHFVELAEYLAPRKF